MAATSTDIRTKSNEMAHNDVTNVAAVECPCTSTDSTSDLSGPPITPRGILKKSNSRKRARVVWNEENLKTNEEQRDAQDKITEPKTPYNFEFNPTEDPELKMLSYSFDLDAAKQSSSGSCTAVVSEEQQQQEEANTQVRSSKKHLSWSSSSEDDEHTPEQRAEAKAKRRKYFEDTRKAHYDEFRTLQLLRQNAQKPNELDDEDM